MQWLQKRGGDDRDEYHGIRKIRDRDIFSLREEGREKVRAADMNSAYFLFCKSFFAATVQCHWRTDVLAKRFFLTYLWWGLLQVFSEDSCFQGERRNKTGMNKFVLVHVVVIDDNLLTIIYSFLENKFLLDSMPEIFLFKYDKNLFVI